MLKPGDAIQCKRGSYTITRKLAEGGMGIVHLAGNPSGKTVVVKEPKVTGDPKQDCLYLEKLQVEAKILSNLNHMNIVKYEDSYVGGNSAYLVVEYLDGESWEKLFSGKSISEDDAEKYILQILDALAYMHNQNVIYRDLKPHNIMLTKKKVNKLIDFGGAKFFYTQIRDPTFQHTQVFTPGWAAPEQMWGGASFQSDIYGAGATLFFLLTGKPPGLYLDAHGGLKPPSDVNHRVKRMSNVVVKATDPDPNKRYQMIGDMISDVQGKLSVVSAPHLIYGNTKYTLSGELTVGRADDCDIAISDPAKFISSYHTRIYEQKGEYWVEDLGSLNGTFITHDPQAGFSKLSPKSPRKLRDNDPIALCYHPRLGPYVTLKFVVGGN